MVERQPEKLKVVGSNPIPDKMLYFFVYIVFLICFSFFTSPLLDFNVFHLIIIFYSYLFCDFGFWNSKSHTTSYNLSFFLSYVLLKVKLLTFSTLNYTLNIFKNLTFFSFSLRWKPLFKKSSYFGIYRSTKNQFLNK